MLSNRLKIVSGAFGAQYALATRFFDQRGALIEGALNVFKQPQNVEIHLPGPGETLLRSAHPENIQLTINPVKTVLQLEPFSSFDEFRALVEKFCNTMNKFYADNRFEFVGVVFKVQEQSNIMSLTKSFPIFSTAFASSVGPITNSRIT